MSREEIFDQLRGHLRDLFAIDPETVRWETRLYQDLDLDSIDAVDLVVRLQQETGKKIKPEDFKAVRTVGDVVEVIDRLLQEG